jgi:CDP-diacylglycerol--glycerol-3-phosphate 3-phosphatidyltransferase
MSADTTAPQGVGATAAPAVGTGVSFGPSALVTPANGVTIARLVAAPVMLALVVGLGTSWTATVAWVALAATDGLDGYLARRHGTTRAGAFLDPLADKFLVLGAMVALVAEGQFWWVPVGIIAARELVISLYRAWMGRRGISIPARWEAKVKTVCQSVAVGFALLPLTGGHHPAVASTFLWLAAGLTVLTGAQYLLDGSRVARGV